MAKKGFKDGMEDLFGETKQEQGDSSLSLFPKEEKNRPEKRSKGFASQLDAFLAEAFEAAEQEKEKDEKRPRRKVSGRQRLSGLDMLIRQTGDQPESSSRSTLTRRLTLAFNKEQLEKLKQIAKNEGIYLKDLINELVDRYISEYEEK